MYIYIYHIISYHNNYMSDDIIDAIIDVKPVKNNKKIKTINKELELTPVKQLDVDSSSSMATTKNQILKEYIEPAYKRDVKNSLGWRYRWRQIGNCVECIAQFFILISTLLAFAAGYEDDRLLSFLSGGSMVISLGLVRYSNYSFKESKERTQELNKILHHLHMKNIPMIVQNDNTDINEKMSSIVK